MSQALKEKIVTSNTSHHPPSSLINKIISCDDNEIFVISDLENEEILNKKEKSGLVLVITINSLEVGQAEMKIGNPYLDYHTNEI